jgi:hypothetical protein
LLCGSNAPVEVVTLQYGGKPASCVEQLFKPYVVGYAKLTPNPLIWAIGRPLSS